MLVLYISIFIVDNPEFKRIIRCTFGSELFLTVILHALGLSCSWRNVLEFEKWNFCQVIFHSFMFMQDCMLYSYCFPVLAVGVGMTIKQRFCSFRFAIKSGKSGNFAFN